MKIQEFRKEIDEIDRQLVALFIQRMDVAARIAQYKKMRDLPIYVPEREAQKLAALRAQAGPELAHYIECLYHTVFQLSRDHQEEQL